jgi:hypothetical protein
METFNNKDITAQKIAQIIVQNIFKSLQYYIMSYERTKYFNTLFYISYALHSFYFPA